MLSLTRTLLFVPGSRPERFSKALNAGADLICIDLEDAVLPCDKNSAREEVVRFLTQQKHQYPDQFQKICVRVNAVDTEYGLKDLHSLAEIAPAHIMLAMCADAKQVKKAETLIASANTRFIALIESLEGLANANEIVSASTQTGALMFGGGDMSAELRCDFSYEPLLHARHQLVQAAARANIALIDVPFINVADEAGLIEETQKVKALGFTGKAAIHPSQITPIHQAFTPSDEQVEYAQAVVSAVEKASSGAVLVAGRMVDRPIILAAERTLSLAQRNSH
jgi:citrate lyase subunit beta/citryl-CoA lyase/(S)-citramalyl-CoA lyase